MYGSELPGIELPDGIEGLTLGVGATLPEPGTEPEGFTEPGTEPEGFTDPGNDEPTLPDGDEPPGEGLPVGEDIGCEAPEPGVDDELPPPMGPTGVDCPPPGADDEGAVWTGQLE